MHRREFIRSLSLGSAVVLAPAISGCGAKDSDAFEAWNGPAPGEEDIRRIVLSYGLLAPNPHNTQAWIISLTGPDSFDLYVDQTRLLPATDPPYRQIHIGQGAFLENVAVGATGHGRRADIVYFPQGEYASDAIERAPVASVTLIEDEGVERDRLFAHLRTRVSNKRAYDATAVTEEDIEALTGAALWGGEGELGLSFEFDLAPAERPRLAEILEEGMRIEVADAARAEETINYFRFNAEERARHRDGFGVPQTGRGGVELWVAESFVLSREKVAAEPAAFNAQAVELTANQARSAAAFGWLISVSNSRRAQVEAGRAYQRLALTAEAQGLAMHPMSQVLQEYPDMAELRREFLALIGAPEGATVQMLFRLGRARPTAHTPRRRLDDIVET